MIKHYKKWLVESIQFPTDHNTIKQILKSYEIKKYSIRSNGTVDIHENVRLKESLTKHFPIKFGIVDGIFNCSYYTKLESLEGAPEKCEGFYCECCYNLKSLKGAPIECKTFYCYLCENLETFGDSFKNCKNFYCQDAKNLKTLEGAPEECDSFSCERCINLKSLKGAPEKCGYFGCHWCENLEYSLKYFPKANKVDIEGTCFEKLYDVIGNDNFIKLINLDSDIEKDKFLLSFAKQKDIDLNIIFNLLSSNEYKHKYRGAIIGNNYYF